MNMLDQSYCIDNILCSTDARFLEYYKNGEMKIKTVSGAIDVDGDKKLLVNIDESTKRKVRLEGSYENLCDLQTGGVVVLIDVPVHAHIDIGFAFYPSEFH